VPRCREKRGLTNNRGKGTGERRRSGAPEFGQRAANQKPNGPNATAFGNRTFSRRERRRGGRKKRGAIAISGAGGRKRESATVREGNLDAGRKKAETRKMG